MHKEFEDDAFTRFLDMVYSVYGYDFKGYAVASLKRRVSHFMNVASIVDLGSLHRKIESDESTFEHFVQELTVTVTEMFRDPSFFLSLRTIVIPKLATWPFIKVWVAGCATGEEAYSLAIILKEHGLLDRSVIFATDINQKSLLKAKDGIFELQDMKGFTRNYQQSGGSSDFSKYYSAKYNAAMFDKSLSANMVFSAHNLAVDRSFNEFQLILCRNVLIYFDQQLQNRVINLFYDSLCTFGILALGNKESLLFSDKQHSFDDVDRREKIFRKAR